MAQEAKPAASESAPFTLQVSSREVILDVVVMDRPGNLHNDLTRENFHITEDGIAKRIDGFEPPSAHMIPTAGMTIRSTADLESRASQSPVNIIVLDELNTSFQDMAFARHALKKYLNAQPYRDGYFSTESAVPTSASYPPPIVPMRVSTRLY
jgi:hypothetical protein